MISSWSSPLSYVFWMLLTIISRPPHHLFVSSFRSFPLLLNRSRSSTGTSSLLTMFSSLQFDNANLRQLPVDKKAFVVGESRQVSNAIFSRVALQPVINPKLVCASNAALALLGLPPITSAINEEDIAIHLGGNKLIPGSEPAAHCYCGHQFGNFAGQLGDGAAMYLGEVIATRKRWELQLKGAGTTPYSRSSDGRKVLRSSIREFLCSEGMHHLGIPTTRAASVVTSDSTVQRDIYYDGNVINERCTIVSRIAQNFFRFGSFEIFKPPGGGDRQGPSAGNSELKKQLLDHIVASYFPTIASQDYRAFYQQVVATTASLCAQWQGCGFVHGVLNTDNMSVMGLTIDYGPYAFLEAYDQDFTPNGSDGGARYTFAHQPDMCRWNLNKLAEALAPLLSPAESSTILAQYDVIYTAKYTEIMTDKLGLAEWEEGGDDALLKGFFSAMTSTRTDFTDAFRALTAFQTVLSETTDASASDTSLAKATTTLVDLLVSRSASPQEVIAGSKRKMRIHRLRMQPEQIQGLWTMLQQDPNQVAEMFGADVEGIRGEVEGEKRKLELLVSSATDIKKFEATSPESKASQDKATWSEWVEMYARRVAKDTAASRPRAQRVEAMARANPTFILRNWVAQEAIEAAEKGDYSCVPVVLRMLETPYDSAFCTMTPTFRAAMGAACSVVEGQGRIVSEDERAFLKPPPSWAASLLCTCSS